MRSHSTTTRLTLMVPMKMTEFPDIDYRNWEKQTRRTFARRSPQMKKLDAAIKAYALAKSQWGLDAITEALDAWKDAKGGGDAWKKSGRDRNMAITLLDNQLSGKGDTDVAIGAQEFMAPALENTRLGVLYLFANLECDESIFKIALGGAVDVATGALDFSGASTAKDVLGKLKTPASVLAEEAESRIVTREKPREVMSHNLLQEPPTPPPLTGALRAAWETIKEAVLDYAKKIWAAICDGIGGLGGKLMATIENPATMELSGGAIPGMLRKVCDVLIAHFFASIAPFVSGALDIAKGVSKTLSAGAAKFKEWWSGRRVVLMKGHPATIVEAIRKAMWMSVGEGMYETLKGTAKIAIDAAAAGASAIFSLIVTICEAVGKAAMRIYEVVKMRGFFREARQLWTVRAEDNALHKQPIAFNQWFKGHVLSVPVLAVLALNSGIVGDKMHFVQMFRDDDSVIGQSQFDHACSYVDGLKQWGSGYLGKTGFEFSSKDPMTAGLLSLATSHGSPSSTGGKVWNVVNAYLEGG